MSSSSPSSLQHPYAHKRPRCIASTRDDFCRSIQAYDGDAARPRGRDKGTESNLFRAAQFAPDGSSIITQSEDQCLRTFIVPSASSHIGGDDDSSNQDNDGNKNNNDSSNNSSNDGTNDSSDSSDRSDSSDGSDGSDSSKVTSPALHLTVHAKFQSPSNILSYSLYPFFDLQNPATSVVLCASADVPITLRNALDFSAVHASYPVVDANTEQHRPIHSLIFSPAGTHVLAGSDTALTVFDAFRAGGEPVKKHRLRLGRRALAATGGWQTCRGMATALDISCEGLVALGTTGRDVALFAHAGLGACAAVFSLAPPLTASGERTSNDSSAKSGSGITALRWSPDGRYLVLAERKSDVVQVYDVRGSGAPLALLHGRSAYTSQRMDIDIVPTNAGFDVYAGGTDGCVRKWENAAAAEGDVQPATVWRMHDAPVSSAVWSRDGSTLTTCSGERFAASDGDGSSEPVRPDNSLKLWQQL